MSLLFSQGGLSLGGYPMGGIGLGGAMSPKARAGLAAYQQVIKALKARGIPEPRMAYRRMKEQGMTPAQMVSSSGSKLRAPRPRAPRMSAGPMMQQAPRPMRLRKAPARPRKAAAAPRKALARPRKAPARPRKVAVAPRRRAPARPRKCPTCKGSGFWGDVWDGIKGVADVAEKVAPLALPLLA